MSLPANIASTLIVLRVRDICLWWNLWARANYKQGQQEKQKH